MKLKRKKFRGRIEWRNPEGMFHREDGPAIEYKNGDKYWFINDKCHREDGPAVEYANGDKEWYINNKYHREDGPAIEYASGHKEWHLNGNLHREDGPAIEAINGFKAWYLDGKKFSEKDFNEKIGLYRYFKLDLLSYSTIVVLDYLMNNGHESYFEKKRKYVYIKIPSSAGHVIEYIYQLRAKDPPTNQEIAG